MCISQQDQKELGAVGIESELLAVILRGEDTRIWGHVRELHERWEKFCATGGCFTYEGLPIWKCFDAYTEEHIILIANIVALIDKLEKDQYQLGVLVLPASSSLSIFFPLIRTDRLVSLWYSGSTWQWFRHILRSCLVQSFALWTVLRVVVGLPSRIKYGNHSGSANHFSKGSQTILFVSDYSTGFPAFFLRPAVRVATACLSLSLLPVMVVNGTSMLKLVPRYLLAIDAGGVCLADAPHIRSICIHMSRSFRRAFESSRSTLDVSQKLSIQFYRTILPFFLFEAVRYTLFMNRLLDQYKPRALCVIPDSSILGIAATLVARRRRVPSVTTHAALVYDHPSFGKLHADTVAVMGPSARKLYLRRGVRDARIFRTGLAAWGKSTHRPDSRNVTNSKNIMFVTENLPQVVTMRALRATIETAAALDGVRIVIRVHPRESLAPYQRLVSSYGNPASIIVDQQSSLVELLGKSDLVILSYSAVAVEAVFAGRDLVSYDFEGGGDPVGLVECGAALAVSNEIELRRTIERVLTNREARTQLAAGRRNFERNQLYGARGSSSHAIARVLKSLTERGL